VLEAADIDRNGEIDWEEFLAATLNNSKLLEEDNIRKVFEVCDADEDDDGVDDGDDAVSDNAVAAAYAFYEE
jgi:Ca2+-binding EF-hand superfamily protein